MSLEVALSVRDLHRWLRPLPRAFRTCGLASNGVDEDH